MKLSFCIITLNEESNLARCLSSIQELAQEIVVVDSGSTDLTADIATTYGAKWVHRPWNGFVQQKNHAIEMASNDWVFSIDADEEISSILRSEIETLRRTEPPLEIAGYSMPRCVFYEGRWIRHGDWYPDRLVRLFRRSHGRYAGGKVHERLELKGRVVTLRGELNHYSFRDRTDHWNRCQKYARLWAETQEEAGRKTNPIAGYNHALFRWLRGFILRLGFLDGRRGWQIAKLSAAEVLLKYRLLYESQRKK